MLSIRFLGVGNAHAYDLGSSSCVLEHEHAPMLLIDCGLDTLPAYLERYRGELPPAVFITHAHLDHVGGLEGLFYKAYFSQPEYRIRLYVPVKLVEIVHKRIAEYPGALAEGGANFWDCFQLIPVSEKFWHREMLFSVFPVRHHEFQSAYGLALKGAFLYTGDTRPIPEVINDFACHGELIFHDCCLATNPSHTCIEEIDLHYRAEQIERMVFYHYESRQAREVFSQRNYRTALRGQQYVLRHQLLSCHDHPVPAPGITSLGIGMLNAIKEDIGA
jgi:ribonuclease BN (tRNA processing enzyme)